MGSPEPCLNGRCFSPMACADWGYCRERNEGRAPSKDEIAARREVARASLPTPTHRNRRP